MAMTTAVAVRPRTLVTGGTGFIGINLTSALVETDREVLIVARHPPRYAAHGHLFAAADVRDRDKLQAIVRAFAPTEVIHLAAQTDFVTWEDAEGFRINTEGTRNLIQALVAGPCACRFFYASSHVALKAAEKQPGQRGLFYADSKLAGEEIVCGAELADHVAVILRPCSIWGPWLGAPFLSFFVAIARGRYFHLGTADPPKRHGYVGNTCRQIIKLLDAPAELVRGRTYCLADYEPMNIRKWAEMIGKHFGIHHIRTLPEPLVRAGAWTGDVLKQMGARNPPLSSFRLANMRANTAGISTDEINRIAGPLPFTFEQGTEITIRWMRDQGIVT
jgi:GlcNAc-P-P-Und epimerase